GVPVREAEVAAFGMPAVVLLNSARHQHWRPLELRSALHQMPPLKAGWIEIDLAGTVDCLHPGEEVLLAEYNLRRIGDPRQRRPRTGDHYPVPMIGVALRQQTADPRIHRGGRAVVDLAVLRVWGNSALAQ